MVTIHLFRDFHHILILLIGWRISLQFSLYSNLRLNVCEMDYFGCDYLCLLRELQIVYIVRLRFWQEYITIELLVLFRSSYSPTWVWFKLRLDSFGLIFHEEPKIALGLSLGAFEFPLKVLLVDCDYLTFEWDTLDSVLRDRFSSLTVWHQDRFFPESLSPTQNHELVVNRLYL